MDIAKEFSEEEGLYFYAFNVNDDPSIPKKLKFRGVPSIVAVKPDPDMPRQRMAKYEVMPEPEKPNKKTWFTVKQMRDFIKKEVK